MTCVVRRPEARLAGTYYIYQLAVFPPIGGGVWHALYLQKPLMAPQAP